MALGFCRECGGKASTEAAACPHCGAVNPTGQPQYAAVPVPAYSPAYPVAQRPSNGVAAVLSLVIPGAGQMYKGHVGTGVAWMFFVFLGYLALIVPGLVLHGICVFNAASAEPRA